MAASRLARHARCWRSCCRCRGPTVRATGAPGLGGGFQGAAFRAVLCCCIQQATETAFLNAGSRYRSARYRALNRLSTPQHTWQAKAAQTDHYPSGRHVRLSCCLHERLCTRSANTQQGVRTTKSACQQQTSSIYRNRPSCASLSCTLASCSLPSMHKDYAPATGLYSTPQASELRSPRARVHRHSGVCSLSKPARRQACAATSGTRARLRQSRHARQLHARKSLRQTSAGAAPRQPPPACSVQAAPEPARVIRHGEQVAQGASDLVWRSTRDAHKDGLPGVAGRAVDPLDFCRISPCAIRDHSDPGPHVLFTPGRH